MQPSNRKPKIIFLTGAGLSADSGLRTFRGSDGLYSGLRGEDVMSAKMLKDSPETVNRFCDDVRGGLSGAEPNEAHRMIARLKGRHAPQILHFAQNFDDLCERAGDEDAVHLHGEIRKMRATANANDVVDIGYRRYWDGPAELAPDQGFRFRSTKSNSPYRTDVVLFGDMAPMYAKLWKAFRNARRDDLVVVIGTQGGVVPVQQLCMMARGSKKVLVNLHESEHIDTAAFDRVFQTRAFQAAGRIEEIVEDHIASFEGFRS